MTNEVVLLDRLIGKVKSYGMDLPATLNEAGEKIIYLTNVDNMVAVVSMNSFMKHQIFATFSNEAQLKLTHWYSE